MEPLPTWLWIKTDEGRKFTAPHNAGGIVGHLADEANLPEPMGRQRVGPTNGQRARSRFRNDKSPGPADGGAVTLMHSHMEDRVPVLDSELSKEKNDKPQPWNPNYRVAAHFGTHPLLRSSVLPPLSLDGLSALLSCVCVCL